MLAIEPTSSCRDGVSVHLLPVWFSVGWVAPFDTLERLGRKGGGAACVLTYGCKRISNPMGIFPPVTPNRILVHDIPHLTTDFVFFVGHFRDSIHDFMILETTGHLQHLGHRFSVNKFFTLDTNMLYTISSCSFSETAQGDFWLCWLALIPSYSPSGAMVFFFWKRSFHVWQVWWGSKMSF